MTTKAYGGGSRGTGPPSTASRSAEGYHGGICKYYKQGTCTLGDNCRYAHVDELPSEGRLSAFGQFRKPILQIVVLFASDTRVFNYAKTVAQKFLDFGIDVFLNSDLTEIGLGEAAVAGQQFIKPEHLSTVISSSQCDYLIVIGDRNMKNDTVQARKAGKLIEMGIDERAHTILEDWARQTGLRLGVDSSNADRAANSLSDLELFERLKALAGIVHAQERIQRVSQIAAEVIEWRKPSRRGGVGGSLVPSDASALSESDQSMVAKLTKSQTALIRLHREFAEASELLGHINVLAGGGSQGVRPPGAPPYLDLGLGPGVSVDARFINSARGGGGDGGRRDGAQVSIASSLRDRLVDLVNDQLSLLEKYGSQISDSAGSGASALWLAYISEYRSNPRGQPKKSSVASSGSSDDGFTGDPIIRKSSAASGDTDAANSFISAASHPVKFAANGKPGTNGNFAAGDAGLMRQSSAPPHPAAVVASFFQAGASARLSTGPSGGRVSTGGKTAAIALRKGEWSCPVCTLVNSPEADKCAACDNKRPVDEWTSTGRGVVTKKTKAKAPADLSEPVSAATANGPSAATPAVGPPLPRSMSNPVTSTSAAAQQRGAQMQPKQPQQQQQPAQAAKVQQAAGVARSLSGPPPLPKEPYPAVAASVTSAPPLPPEPPAGHAQMLAMQSPALAALLSNAALQKQSSQAAAAGQPATLSYASIAGGSTGQQTTSTKPLVGQKYEEAFPSLDTSGTRTPQPREVYSSKPATLQQPQPPIPVARPPVSSAPPLPALSPEAYRISTGATTDMAPKDNRAGLGVAVGGGLGFGLGISLDFAASSPPRAANDSKSPGLGLPANAAGFPSASSTLPESFAPAATAASLLGLNLPGNDRNPFAPSPASIANGPMLQLQQQPQAAQRNDVGSLFLSSNTTPAQLQNWMMGLSLQQQQQNAGIVRDAAVSAQEPPSGLPPGLADGAPLFGSTLSNRGMGLPAQAPRVPQLAQPLLPSSFQPSVINGFTPSSILGGAQGTPKPEAVQQHPALPPGLGPMQQYRHPQAGGGQQPALPQAQDHPHLHTQGFAGLQDPTLLVTLLQQNAALMAAVGLTNPSDPASATLLMHMQNLLAAGHPRSGMLAPLLPVSAAPVSSTPAAPSMWMPTPNSSSGQPAATMAGLNLPSAMPFQGLQQQPLPQQSSTPLSWGAPQQQPQQSIGRMLPSMPRMGLDFGVAGTQPPGGLPDGRVSVDKPCQVCGKESSLSCGMCASEPPYVPTYYCSSQHQVMNFNEHKKYHEEMRKKYKYPGMAAG